MKISLKNSSKYCIVLQTDPLYLYNITTSDVALYKHTVYSFLAFMEFLGPSCLIAVHSREEFTV